MRLLLALLLFPALAFAQKPNSEERIAALEARIAAQANQLDAQAKEIAELRELVAGKPASAKPSAAATPTTAVANATMPTLIACGTTKTSDAQAEACMASYTAEGRKKKVSGTVKLRVTILADGTVDPSTIRVTSGLGYGLDERAIAVVKTWKFRPATENGKPVPILATIEIVFKLI